MNFHYMPTTTNLMHMCIWYLSEKLAGEAGVTLRSPDLNSCDSLDDLAALIVAHYELTGEDHEAGKYYPAIYDGVLNGDGNTKEAG